MIIVRFSSFYPVAGVQLPVVFVYSKAQGQYALAREYCAQGVMEEGH